MSGLLVASLAAQTKVTLPKNKYTPEQDVKLGLEAAESVRKELPLFDDGRTREYVQDLGQRIVAVIPAEYKQPLFRYTFEVVNQKEINAFALPGGPMFVNRGMIEAATTEGEVMGVMAHELSHVLLRHGTAQATEGQKFQIGSVLGQVAGAVIGGGLGNVIAQGANLGFGTYFLKYGRKYEKQADILGAQIMARAGYDPRDMANMFKTIEKQGGGGGPEWLSSHPNPGNRSEYIQQEAKLLPVTGPGRSNGEFQQMKARLKEMSPAYTAEQIAKMQKQGRVSDTSTASPPRTVNVGPPSRRFRTHTASNLRISVPDNWAPQQSGNSLMYAPEGAFFRSNGGTAFTHGVQVGVSNAQTRDLERETNALIEGFSKSNPELRWGGAFRRTSVANRDGVTTTLRNVSEVTGEREVVDLSTAFLSEGTMLYVIGVAPESVANSYAEVFARIREDLRTR